MIREFIDSGLLYEDAKYHNCVFVGRDTGGKAVFEAPIDLMSFCTLTTE